jgi:hypothetical protein
MWPAWHLAHVHSITSVSGRYSFVDTLLEAESILKNERRYSKVWGGKKQTVQAHDMAVLKEVRTSLNLKGLVSIMCIQPMSSGSLGHRILLIRQGVRVHRLTYGEAWGLTQLRENLLLCTSAFELLEHGSVRLLRITPLLSPGCHPACANVSSILQRRRTGFMGVCLKIAGKS